MSSSICLTLLSFFQNAAIHPMADADQPVRKVPSRDGYPRRSSLMVQHRWEMKDPSAQCIWHNRSWRISILCQNGREHVGDAVRVAQRRRRLQERVLRGQAALGERAQRERLGVAQPDTAADGILHAHEQVPQLV